MSLTLLAHAWHHGEPRKDKHDFWRTAACTALEAAQLYAGGFFVTAQAEHPSPSVVVLPYCAEVCE